VSAKAFAQGFNPSGVASAKFTVTVTPPASSIPSPNVRPRDELLAELEAFKVWFNFRKGDPKIVNPPGYTLAGQQAKEMGALGQRREWYLQQAVKLEKEFKTNSLTPSPSGVFDDLKKRIKNWE
jgi:hypothetical protein